jgi:uncharacterized protein
LTMRISVIADTHMPRGRRALSVECLDRLRRAQLILHAGDVTGLSFLDWLQDVGPPVAAVFGNADDPEVRRELPHERVVEAAGMRIGMVHIPGPTVGRGERLIRRFPGCEAIVYGHTHALTVERVEGVWLLNPGSPTERRRSPTRTMLELVVRGSRLSPRLIDLGS